MPSRCMRGILVHAALYCLETFSRRDLHCGASRLMVTESRYSPGGLPALLPPSSCHSFKPGLLFTLKATCVAAGFTDHVSTRRGSPPDSFFASTKRTSFRIVGGPSNRAAVMDGGIIRNMAGDLKNDRAGFELN